MSKIIFSLLSFLLFFNANATTIQIIRGPYIQRTTQYETTLRWRTNTACSSEIQYGIGLNNLNNSILETTVTQEHTIRIPNLQPNTKYYYSIRANDTLLVQDSVHYFTTYPITGDKQKFTYWVTGDCGDGSINQKNVRNAYLNYIGNKNTDAWLLLGDNAYYYGTDTEYENNFFNIYENNIMPHTTLFPAPGNHDYLGVGDAFGTRSNMAYYQSFVMPTEGELNGYPSHNPSYYSYDIGTAHFISLDSYGRQEDATKLYDTLGAQAVWLKQDLAQCTQTFKIAYWHHPPFTKGSHNSDTEADLTAIRTKFIGILERYGVDLILCGHSHCYERSYFIHDFYGPDSTFNVVDNTLTTSNGYYDGSNNSCAYQKDNHDEGTIYVVSGSAGKMNTTQSPGYPHDAMVYSNTNKGGSVVIEIEDNRLDLKWLGYDGVVRDNFTLLKNTGKQHTIYLNTGQDTTLTASWVGGYEWDNDATSRSVSISPTANTTRYVTDPQQCITDTFSVIINGISGIQNTATNTAIVYTDANTVTSLGGIIQQLTLFDMQGKQIHTTIPYTTTVQLPSVATGIYLLTTTINSTTYYQKIYLTINQ